MKLKCKILPKYLKAILDGTKDVEYRQVESIVLINSKTGKEHEFEVTDLWMHKAKDVVFEAYPDIKWDRKKQILCIGIGKKVNRK